MTPASTKTPVLPTHTPELFVAAVRQAVELLCAGEVVALPTETVYGLAANAFNADAVAKVYQAKGRPAHNPIIVHVADIGLAKRCVAEWPATAGKLATSFWPGPLTMVLPSSNEIPAIVTAGGATVGVRWPSHPFIQAVIRECGFPLAAPSANPSNQISPTNARHVSKELDGKVSLIVDGGQSQVGIESTVIDLATSTPRILRPGMIHEESIAAVLGTMSGAGCQVSGDGALRSPGMLKKHYSPKAKLKILSWHDDDDLHAQAFGSRSTLPNHHVIAFSHIPSPDDFARVCVIPHDAEAFARAIYAELHRCDEEGAEVIIVEAPPETAEWRAISDRLKRAAAS
ncbi:MAG TPA: L-threonylcarbamoyladenylate synthase [Candidatus Paceibacterota bacterium]|nr:L-threonylcarbamoyladenylate synthase [Candidatus Paceibacterota bacterium]